jgi:hypothetical protein
LGGEAVAHDPRSTTTGKSYSDVARVIPALLLVAQRSNAAGRAAVAPFPRSSSLPDTRKLLAMTTDRPHSQNRALAVPPRRERQSLPRFDEPCRCGRPPYTVEFRRDGTVLVDGEPGTWKVDPRKTVRIATPRWRCEGTIGLDDLHLLCALEDSATADIQFGLRLGPEVEMRGAAAPGCHLLIQTSCICLPNTVLRTT